MIGLVKSNRNKERLLNRLVLFTHLFLRIKKVKLKHQKFQFFKTKTIRIIENEIEGYF